MTVRGNFAAVTFFSARYCAITVSLTRRSRLAVVAMGRAQTSSADFAASFEVQLFNRCSNSASVRLIAFLKGQTWR